MGYFADIKQAYQRIQYLHIAQLHRYRDAWKAESTLTNSTLLLHTVSSRVLSSAERLDAEKHTTNKRITADSVQISRVLCQNVKSEIQVKKVHKRCVATSARSVSLATFALISLRKCLQLFSSASLRRVLRGKGFFCRFWIVLLLRCARASSAIFAWIFLRSIYFAHEIKYEMRWIYLLSFPIFSSVAFNIGPWLR